MTGLNGPVFVRTDGSVRGENHPSGPSAAIGYVIEENGEQIEIGHENVSDLTTSSSVAEYIALDHALRRLLSIGFSGWVFVKTDSQNLADLMNGASPRTEESAEWLEKIWTLIDQFEGCTVSKTKREFTVEAHDEATNGHHAEQTKGLF